MKNIIVTISLFVISNLANAQHNLFQFDENIETRWSSPENKHGLKGKGGMENNQAKGHAFDSIAPGASYTLLDVQEMGIVNRIWITIDDRSPEMLRSLKIEMYWDGEIKPAVSVPFGDFFGIGLGKTAIFENALFANPEGRSFNCFIQMPFRKSAKILIVNESNRKLGSIFYDVNYNLLKKWNPQYMYFHSYWHRDFNTKLAEDFEILPAVTGKGRFIGTNIGVFGNRLYGRSWFGEGEVKIYLDGDNQYPTLVGTGTEDYIGTAWGQGKFINTYTGCTIADDSLLQWAFYRFHIIDPVFFHNNIRVTIQQIGGDVTEKVAKFQAEKSPLIPVSTNDFRFYKKDSIVDMNNPALLKGWTNFYRSDDVSAVAYFYFDKPGSNLPPIQALAARIKDLERK
jgi:hypothetical protein